MPLPAPDAIGEMENLLGLQLCVRDAVAQQDDEPWELFYGMNATSLLGTGQAFPQVTGSC